MDLELQHWERDCVHVIVQNSQSKNVERADLLLQEIAEINLYTDASEELKKKWAAILP